MPPAKKAPRGRGHSRHLDREQVVAAALELARTDGLERVSMRRIAARLEVDVSALYWHFQSRDDLFRQVEDAAARSVVLPLPAAGPWRDRIFEACRSIRAHLREHPELSLVAGNERFMTPFNAQATGLLVGILEGAGLEGARLYLASQALLHLVTALAGNETALQSASVDDVRRFVRGVADNLPPESAEGWRALIRGERATTLDMYFDYAIRALIDGFALGAPSAGEDRSTGSSRAT